MKHVPRQNRSIKVFSTGKIAFLRDAIKPEEARQASTQYLLINTIHRQNSIDGLK